MKNDWAFLEFKEISIKSYIVDENMFKTLSLTRNDLFVETLSFPLDIYSFHPQIKINIFSCLNRPKNHINLYGVATCVSHNATRISIIRFFLGGGHRFYTFSSFRVRPTLKFWSRLVFRLESIFFPIFLCGLTHSCSTQ